MKPENIHKLGDVLLVTCVSLILGAYNMELLKALFCLAFFVLLLVLELKMIHRQTFNPVKSDADAFALPILLMAGVGIVFSVAWAWGALPKKIA